MALHTHCYLLDGLLSQHNHHPETIGVKVNDLVAVYDVYTSVDLFFLAHRPLKMLKMFLPPLRQWNHDTPQTHAHFKTIIYPLFRFLFRSL